VEPAAAGLHRSFIQRDAATKAVGDASGEASAGGPEAVGGGQAGGPEAGSGGQAGADQRRPIKLQLTAIHRGSLEFDRSSWAARRLSRAAPYRGRRYGESRGGLDELSADYRDMLRRLDYAVWLIGEMRADVRYMPGDYYDDHAARRHDGAARRHNDDMRSHGEDERRRRRRRRDEDERRRRRHNEEMDRLQARNDAHIEAIRAAIGGIRANIEAAGLPRRTGWWWWPWS